MFVCRDNCSTFYIHKQSGSFTAFDIVVSFKPFDRFSMITKHIPVSLFYTYVKSLLQAIISLPNTTAHATGDFAGQYAQEKAKTWKPVCKNKSVMLQELVCSVQYITEYHLTAFVHQGLRKEIKKPQLSPLPPCFWVSFATANHVHPTTINQSILPQLCRSRNQEICWHFTHPFFRKDKNTLPNHVNRHIN